VVNVTGYAYTPYPPPNFNFTLSQAFTLNVVGNTIELRASGEPELSPPIVGFVADLLDVMPNTNTEITNQARPVIRDILAGFSDILENLRAPTLDVEYRSVEIGPDGIVLRGGLRLASWDDVVASCYGCQTGFMVGGPGYSQFELNALRSWIPGGTIQRYEFSWSNILIIPAPLPEDWVIEPGYLGVKEEEHQFVTRFTLEHISLRASVRPLNVCVVVRGLQDPGAATPRNVVGNTCIILSPRLFRKIPGLNLLERYPILVWQGGNAIAHMELLGGDEQGASPESDTSGISLILHFAGSHKDSNINSITLLRNALLARSAETGMAFVITVLPSRLGKIEENQIKETLWANWTEDAEGSWTKAFNVKEVPATYLVNPKGEIAWQHIGQLDKASLGAALNKYLVKGDPVRWRQIRLKVQEGNPAPDFLFNFLKGHQMALRTLRGQPVIITFWTSWSKPSLTELRRLQKLHEQFGKQGLLILAINDGEDPQRAQGIFEQNKFTFNFVADADRRISRLFGVSCWPTTVKIDKYGIVRQIQFGVTKDKRFA
jgi:peroxiredoxin